MIKSISLQNWKTHQKTKLSFKKGTNIILGTIGSGKSSVIDGICYALYGNFPSLQNRKVILTENIMFKPAKMESSKIVLELNFNNNNYTIEREIYLSSKANYAKLYQDQKLIAGPKQTDVNEKVSEILGIDYNLFTKIVYSEQNELDYFLKIQPSKRKEKFDELFGIIHLKEIKEDTKKLENLVSIEIDKQQSLFNQIISQLKDIDINLLNSKKEDAEKNLITISKDLQDFKIKKEQLEKEVKILKSKKQNFENLTLQLNINKSKLQEIDQKINTYLEKYPSLSSNFQEQLRLKEQQLLDKEKEFLLFSNKNKDLEIKNKDLNNKLSFYKEQLQVNQDNVTSLLKKLTPTTKSSDILKTELENLNKDLETIKTTQINLNSITQDLNKAISELKKGFANCPVCDSKLNPEQVTQKLEEKELKSSLVFKQLQDIKDNLLSLNKKKQELESLDKQLQVNNTINQEINTLKEKSYSFEEKLKDLNTLIVSLEKPKDLSSLDKEIQTIKEEIFSLKSYSDFLKNKEEVTFKINNFSQSLKDLNFNEDTYISLLSEFKNTESKFLNLNDKKELFSNILLDVNKNINTYFLLDSQKQKLTKTISALELKKTDLSYFSKSLEVSQHQLRKVLIDNINQALNIIWPKVYAYNDYKSARLQANNDYILEVLSLEGEWYRVEGILSGGERSCAALSIRVAIALVLTEKLGLLILDEPTHNLDEKSVQSLATILEKELPDLVDQVFIVTHDSKLLETVNSSKFIINRDKENDGVSLVDES
ncbi:MAG: SMC family ATPase [archaeon]|nr:SMC family ATPase [archaeon]MDD2477807.1 SMC family ATPase [Candidatus ainarchaeum sp.]MDD3084681.1 SMC family ATPase [Candidatus ainarchaeum sp.]MDD4221227.1 SMC family ATPase [Candidatus ainarchaeum sp.]MDD4662734.1 SMC family ATPase [Candidatus ainarchaeum sp.]